MPNINRLYYLLDSYDEMHFIAAKNRRQLKEIMRKEDYTIEKGDLIVNIGFTPRESGIFYVSHSGFFN